jgi:hypothetical protein
MLCPEEVFPYLQQKMNKLHDEKDCLTGSASRFGSLTVQKLSKKGYSHSTILG